MIKSLLAAAIVASSVAAQAMPVSDFVTKANALEKKGVMALLSSDFRVLKNEGNSATQAAVREERAAVKAGRKPTMCFPKDNKLSLGTSEVLNHMRAVPAAQRGMSVKDAMAGLLRKKYPCPA
jgi:hypothetical protein